MANTTRSRGARAELLPDGSMLLEVPMMQGTGYRRVAVERGEKSAGRKRIRKDYARGRKPSGRR